MALAVVTAALAAGAISWQSLPGQTGPPPQPPTVAPVAPAATARGPPSDVAASPDGAWIYVADNGSGTVTVIDAATATVAATVPVGVSPVALAVAPDSSRIYVVDGTADTITLLQRP